jgi:hypothetical protein
VFEPSDAYPFLWVAVNRVDISQILNSVTGQDIGIDRSACSQSIRDAEDSAILRK